MTLTFDVTTHLLLSKPAAALDQPVLEMHNLLAEVALGINGAAFRGAAAVDAAALAVVLQLNFQVARGVDAVLAVSTSSGKSGQATTYREVDVNPTARRIIETLRTASTGGTSPDGWSLMPSKWGLTR